MLVSTTEISTLCLHYGTLTFSVVDWRLWDLYKNSENPDFEQVLKLDNQAKLISKWLWREN